MKKIAYLDCFSGASGDMLLGALLDAGLSFEQLQKGLNCLGLEAYELTCEKQTRKGITGCKFDVIDKGSDRPARNLSLVEKVLADADLPQAVASQSLAIFRKLAEAEAKVHGTTVDAIHFHEVGAVDSLIDIVGFCWALHRLEIEKIYASPLPTGSGTVTTEHGLLPLPAPATLAMLSSVGAPLVPSQAETELVTPTGAAILATLASFERPAIRVQSVGYGFGTRQLPWANVLRVWIGQGVAEEADRHEHAHSHEHGHTHVHGDPHGHDDPHEHEHHHHSHEHRHPHEEQHVHGEHRHDSRAHAEGDPHDHEEQGHSADPRA